MIKNYFKTAWRNLVQSKGLSAINILGLAIGMAFAMLIGLWMKFETSFDSFHFNKDRLAMVLKNTLFNDERNTQEAVPLPLYDELKSNYPEVKRTSRVSWNFSRSLMVDDAKFSSEGRYVDPEFLQMFTFPLLSGNIQTALNDPNSIILTETMATALFGKTDAVGKTIRIDNQYDVKVAGILKDLPKNSTLQFEFLAPYEFLINTTPFLQNNRANWGNNMLMTMVELKEGVSMEAFSKKIGPLSILKDKTLKNQAFFLHPLNKWHLENEYKNWVNTGGKMEYVRLFGIIGVFVLVIACINFMNLSTARSEKRAREVGIRKTLGSRRNQLVFQFFCEAMFTSFLAFLLSIGIIQLLLSSSFFRELGFQQIRLDLSNISLVTAGFLVCIITGLIAGSYPALYLSSFVPVKVLKGIFRQGKGPVVFRKTLVVFQFAISVGLIISTVIVFQQINHARTRSLGYNPDNLISINGSQDLADNYEILKTELLNTGYLEAVSRASSPLTAVYNSWSDFSWEGKPPGSDIALDAILAEWDFEKTAGFTFKEGRPFSRDYKTDSNAVILNEAALKVIGYKDPIGRTMKSGNQVLTIVGIIENVVILDPFKQVNPTAILFSGNKGRNSNKIFLRLKTSAELRKALAAIQSIFDKYNPSLPFEYTFVDEDFAKKFTIENQVGKLSGIFAGLAIFISCLGLFGLTAFIAERRIKEIGIRKVLGATVGNLWILLSSEFIMLVLLSCLIASPLTFWLMKDWLQKYDYRIDISGWVIGLVGLLAITIALITVSTQAIKAAVANPVKSLRTE